MRSHLRLASVVGAATLIVVAVAPAMAAAPVSQSGANAVNVAMAGNSQGTGDVTAVNDGSNETRTGSSEPPLSVLGGQQVLTAGVLAQQATAGADSTSAACAGLAGNGGSVAQVGDSSCLTPGTPVNATLGSLDLSSLVVADPASALAPVNDVLGPLLAELTPALDDAIDQVQVQFGDLGLVAGFGAVEGRCTAALGSATGEATLADAQISLVLPDEASQQSLTLLDLPVKPAPNTHLTTDLSDVLDLVIEALETNLGNSLNGVADPLSLLTDEIQSNIVSAIRADAESNLAPLEQNVLDLTLNRQIRPTNDSIKVRALDLTILPALEDQLDASLVNLQIGNAGCGPSGRIQAAAGPAAPAAIPAIPTGVSAGYESVPPRYAGQGDEATSRIVLGALALLVATSAGFVAFRRLRG